MKNKNVVNNIQNKEYCVDKNETKEFIESIELDDSIDNIVIKEETNEFEIKIDERQVLIDDIRLFVRSMAGKYSMSNQEVDKAFSLHNKYFNRNEKPQYCSICVARIFTNLKEV